MKCVLALCILLAFVYSLEGKPGFKQNRKSYGISIGHPFISVCEQEFNCGGKHFMGRPECVPASAVCNGVPDCSNGADENNCAYPNCWSRGMIQCSDGKTCAKWCNNFPECPNLEDEMTCPTICPKGNLLCEDDKTCVKSDRICDGYEDCPGGEDENRCQPKEEFVLCSEVCDGNEQCSDGNDEKDCLTYEAYRSRFIQQYFCLCNGTCNGQQWCLNICLDRRNIYDREFSTCDVQ